MRIIVPVVSSHKPIKNSLFRFAVMTIAALFVFWPSTRATKAASGDLDPGFGFGGKVTTDFFGFNNHGSDVVIQPDGKIVVAGYAWTGTGRLYDYAVARYMPDGSPDHGFGLGGKASAQIYDMDGVSSVALAPDGKIIVAGNSQTSMGKPCVSLASFNADGSLYFARRYQGLEFSYFNDVAVQPDGRIILVGRSIDFRLNTSLQSTYYLYLKRLLPNGDDDLTFGDNSNILDNSLGSANAVAIQPDGKILAASGLDGDFVLLRYNNDGSPDASFGSGGKVRTNVSNLDSTAGIALQLDGKIVVAGNANVGIMTGDSDFALVRYMSNGKLDKKFGSGGKVITDFGSSDVAKDVAILPDGDIIVAGSTIGNNTGRDFALARYYADGSLNPEFGPGGKVTTDFYGDEDEANGVAIQNGKVVAAGHSKNGVFYFTLARYGEDANFDLCLQDDGSSIRLLINSKTGEYLLTNCSGFAVGGTGALTRKGNTITLTDSRADRRVKAQIQTSAKKGSASIQLFALSRAITITDRDTTDNTCSCQ